MNDFSFKDNSEKLINDVNSINGRTGNLFPVEFMSKNTNFSTISEMAETYGKADSIEDLENNPDFDNFVSQNSKFSTWEEMVKSAQENFIRASFGFL